MKDLVKRACEQTGEKVVVIIDEYAAKRKMVECLDLPLDYEVPTINVDMNPLHRKIYEDFVKQELELAKQRKLAGESHYC